MNQYLFVDGGVVCRRFDSDPVSELGQPVVASEDGPQPVPALNALRDWKKRYALASVRNDENVLREIGTEMFDWLDTAGALSDWMKPAERHLQILPDDNSNPELATALMEAPWEILFNRGFLAADLAQLFVVSRRVMKPSETPWDPSHGDLRMMFMAAAPEGVSELDYEAEEVAIINATQSAAGSSSLAHLVVEESGALELLSERLDGRDGDFEVLHLSCHGDIIAPRGDDGTRHGAERPVLILEGVDGTPHEVSAPEMISTCQGTMPPLVFVSACRTAQRGGPDTLRGAADMRRTGMGEGVGLLNNPLHTRDIGKDQAAPIAEAAEPYVLELVRGVGNVLGWDGSVYDHDASAFATGFYRALSRGRNVPTAAAVARRDLIQERQRDPKNGRHWHLARVYLGAEGGGPICKPGLKGRDVPATVPEFLDSENKIRVAGRETFVGRRRTIQKALTTLRSGDRGLLTHGIGNLGKSSLAKRIADRLISYQTVVVVSPRADLGSANGRVIFEKLKAAMGKRADALEYGSPQAEELRNQAAAMEADLAEAPERFETILRSLLAGPFKNEPIFLVLDDFENSLETPTSEAPIPKPKAHLLRDLQAVFRAFAGPGITSRFMVTCRYDFSVPDAQGNDLTVPFLERIPLKPMNEREGIKQWQARERARKTGQGETTKHEDIDEALVWRIRAASSGNPGLQEVLTQPLLRGASDEVTVALEKVEAFLASGEIPPPDEDVGDFFARMTFEVYESALDGTTRLALSIARAFSPSVSIPCAALEAAMGAMGISAPDAALHKLLALGLLDDHGLQAGWPGMTKSKHAAINPLARPLADELGEKDLARMAQVVLPLLAEAWQDDEGHFPYDLRAVEVTKTAMVSSGFDSNILAAAATCAVVFLFKLSENAPAAVRLAEPALDRLIAFNIPPSALLLGHTIRAAERVGAVDLQDRLIDAALDRTDIEDRALAQLKGLHCDRLMRRGDLDGALQIRETEQLPVYEALGDKRSLAVTKSQIADILQMRGDLDGALRIRQEEVMSAFEALGDKRSLAVTKSKIADILQMRGDLDGALWIREEEVLPAFEALGVKREIAVTKGKIADILQMRGNLDRALRISEEEVLPTFEALGDKRSLAFTKGKIADILEMRGDLDGALQIRETEQLPVYEALGDKRSLAVTKGKIADIFQMRGDLDGALRIREEEQLPVYEALGDKRESAVTKGKIADIFQMRGDLDGALALHLERLPIAEAMQDLDSIVHIKFSCARIRLERGDHYKGEAQTIIDELDEAFRGALQLQRPHAIGAIGPLLGQVLAASGSKEPARQVLDITEPAYITLGDETGLAHISELRNMIGADDDADT